MAVNSGWKSNLKLAKFIFLFYFLSFEDTMSETESDQKDRRNGELEQFDRARVIWQPADSGGKSGLSG